MVTRIASRTTAYFDIGQAKKENKVLNQYIRFHTIIVSMKIENNMTLVKFKFQIFNQINTSNNDFHMRLYFLYCNKKQFPQQFLTNFALEKFSKTEHKRYFNGKCIS